LEADLRRALDDGFKSVKEIFKGFIFNEIFADLRVIIELGSDL